jgi:hypothetical protein
VVARLLGGWLISESRGTAGPRSFTWILTLGYDPAQERFVATWIDSMQSHLWLYEGGLDDSGTALTLETEGPTGGDPARPARFHVVIEVLESDHYVMRSSILGPNGEWFEFSRADYRRVQ